MSELIGLTVAERIATVTLARAPVNAFNAEMFKAFHGILDGLAARSDWSVLHIRSAPQGVLGRRGPRRDLARALRRPTRWMRRRRSRGRSRSCSSASPICRR